MYTATKWNTAKDKEKFFKQYCRFVEKNFPQRLFTKEFYKRLSMMFGHIAHYNQAGFWDTWFESAASRVLFIANTLRHPCYGDPEWTWSDVERNIQTWLKEHDILNKLAEIANKELTQAEYAEYTRLKEKFETT